MEKEYIKELDRACLVLVNDQIDEDEYVMQMAIRGRLPGILPLSVFSKDGKKSLRADVTACTSISSRFKSTQLTGSDVRKILFSVRDTASKMPALLMSVRDLYLDPECVFLGPGGDEVLLCYVPHISDTEPDSVRLLAEFLLKKLDHSDQTAMQLAYPLFDQVSADSYDLSEILSKLLPDAENGTGRKVGSASFSKGGPSNSQSPYAEEGRPPGSAHEDRTHAYGRGYAGEDNAGAYGSSGPGGTPGRSAYAGRSKSSYSKNRRQQKASGHTGKGSPSGRSNGSRKKISPGSILPAVIILTIAVILIVVFRMDMTQILGMGFLCVSLIWIIHSSLEKRSNEARNIWFDEEEDMESDDQFYQSLRKELYAEDPQFGQDPYSSRQGTGPAYQNSQTAWSGTGKEWQDSQSAWQGADPAYQNSQTAWSGSGKEWQNSQLAWQGHGPASQGTEGAEASERTRYLRHQSPALISLEKERCQDIHLDQDHLILGKSRTQADITLPGDTVSRKHARIERRMDGYYVTDLFSTNGTFLDGHRLESGQAVALKDGAQLTIATLPYRVMIPE